MQRADDRRLGCAAETAAGRCLDRSFFHSEFPGAAIPYQAKGETGNHYLVLRGPIRLTHIRQVQSAPVDTWTCYFSLSMLVENR